MPENRYFVPHLFQQNHTIYLLDEEAKHLIRVMRKKVGDVVELINGKWQLARATISSIGKKEVELSIVDVKTESPPKRKIILAQGMTKPSNLDLIIEKGTELGAAEFWLFPGEKSEKQALTPNQKERLKKISIAALKQCGRLDLPEIHEKKPLAKWPTLSQTEILYGDLSEQSSSFPGSFQAATILMIIGPEGGFSPNELHILSKMGRGIRLNANILRTETAAICALSLLGYSRYI